MKRASLADSPWTWRKRSGSRRRQRPPCGKWRGACEGGEGDSLLPISDASKPSLFPIEKRARKRTQIAPKTPETSSSAAFHVNSTTAAPATRTQERTAPWAFSVSKTQNKRVGCAQGDYCCRMSAAMRSLQSKRKGIEAYPSCLVSTCLCRYQFRTWSLGPRKSRKMCQVDSVRRVYSGSSQPSF